MKECQTTRLRASSEALAGSHACFLAGRSEAALGRKAPMRRAVGGRVRRAGRLSRLTRVAPPSLTSGRALQRSVPDATADVLPAIMMDKRPVLPQPASQRHPSPSISRTT